jgi:hypothetical protein
MANASKTRRRYRPPLTARCTPSPSKNAKLSSTSSAAALEPSGESSGRGVARFRDGLILPGAATRVLE